LNRIYFGVLILSVLFIITSCTDNDIKYNKGQYEGSSVGHEGTIRVKVEIDDNKIINIEILEEYEMPEISIHVYDKIIKRVIRNNKADINTISGATFTSKALIEAIDDALQKALTD